MIPASNDDVDDVTEMLHQHGHLVCEIKGNNNNTLLEIERLLNDAIDFLECDHPTGNVRRINQCLKLIREKKKEFYSSFEK